MLYQLSYASPAQTKENYHTGNRIASGFCPAGQTNPFALRFRLPFQFLEVSLYRRSGKLAIVNWDVMAGLGDLDRHQRLAATLVNRER